LSLRLFFSFDFRVSLEQMYDLEYNLGPEINKADPDADLCAFIAAHRPILPQPLIYPFPTAAAPADSSGGASAVGANSIVEGGGDGGSVVSGGIVGGGGGGIGSVVSGGIGGGGGGIGSVVSGGIVGGSVVGGGGVGGGVDLVDAVVRSCGGPCVHLGLLFGPGGGSGAALPPPPPIKSLRALRLVTTHSFGGVTSHPLRLVTTHSFGGVASYPLR
jgi:hypothetical protein